MLKAFVESDQIKEFDFDLNTNSFDENLKKDSKYELYFVFNRCTNQAVNCFDNPDFYCIMSPVKNTGN